MRKLFCEQARSFFKTHLKVDITAKNHYIKLNEQLAEKNIMKSKVINLLPKEDLAIIVSHPCFIRFKEEFVGFQHLQDKITSFKKLRFFLDIPEESACGKCSISSVCPLFNKKPEAKVTSSKDVLWLMYYMAYSAHFAETNAQAAATPGEKAAEPTLEELLDAESSKQSAEMDEALNDGDKKSGKPLKLPPDTPLSPDKEFALYLSGIRVLDQLGILICNTVQEKQVLDELLETQISEYSTRKKLDQALRLETAIRQTATKKRDKREETKGVHDLVAENKRNMEQFSKRLEPVDSEVEATPNPKVPAEEPASNVGVKKAGKQGSKWTGERRESRESVKKN